MGTIIAVDSVVYNMAGEEANRPHYMKSLVVRNVLSGTKESISSTLNNGYLGGPGIKLRNFYRWSTDPDNYGEVGLPTGSLEIHGALNASLVASAITPGVGQTVWVQTARVGYAEVEEWARQWVMVNRPADIDTAWTADYSESLNEILITFADISTTTITPVNFDYEARYVYAYYGLVDGESTSALVTGDTIILTGGDVYPSGVDWVLLSEVLTPTIYRVYERRSATGTSDQVITLVETMHQYDDGVEESYRIDTQEFTYREYDATQLLIYKVGSGNTDLDALVTASTSYGDFFPFLPIRIENEFLSETYLPDAYAQVKRAYKKATGGKFDSLIADLEDNDNLADIDHAYVTFGVSLNVVEKSCKKYLYTFFEKLQLSQAGGPSTYSIWQADVISQQATFDAWLAWVNNPFASSGRDPDPEPSRPSFASMPVNRIRINGDGAVNSHFDVRIEWSFITNGSGTGLAKIGAKKGDYWFEYIGTDTITQTVYTAQNGGSTVSEPGLYEKIRLYHQVDDGSYTWLEIIGLIHRNYIYAGRAAVTSAKTALEDADESGFIVPLHYDTWREVPLVDSTQMATACVFIVFNSYVAKKTKWYQSGIFRILLVIVIAIASVVLTGGAGLGLLGAHLAVGSALGFVGLTAAIVGAVVNAMAALILSTIVSRLASSLGPIGQIIGAVLMILAGNISASLQNGTSISMHWDQLLRVDNLLKLTDATGRAISDMISADTMGMQSDWDDYSKKMAKESNEIQQAYFEEFGYGGGLIDPMMFVDSTQGPIAESSDTFLTRTLMSGSEIAEMSRELLYEFPDYSLALPDAFT